MKKEGKKGRGKILPARGGRECFLYSREKEDFSPALGMRRGQFLRGGEEKSGPRCTGWGGDGGRVKGKGRAWLQKRGRRRLHQKKKHPTSVNKTGGEGGGKGLFVTRRKKKPLTRRRAKLEIILHHKKKKSEKERRERGNS